jgi:hypothetical protein
METPREYRRALRQAVKDTLAQGRRVDFHDAIAVSRISGEQAVFWLHPALKSAQHERDALLVRCAELRALLDEYFALEGDPALLAEWERRAR